MSDALGLLEVAVVYAPNLAAHNMAKVFLSWGSPDESIVDEIADRLESVGLDIFFSKHHMRPGDTANQRVQGEIREAELAVFALSNQSVARDWMQAELIQCAGFVDDPKSPMEKLLPVVVGGFDERKIPEQFDIRDLHRLDLRDPLEREQNLGKLVSEIARVLGFEMPLTVPAAMFAMTSAQFEVLCREGADGLGELLDLCRSVGMDGATDQCQFLREVFSHRYGGSPEAFAPFLEEKPLKELIQNTVAQLNISRRLSGQRSIWLRWDTTRLLDTSQELPEAFIETRGSSSCLTIVDSISAFHPDVNEALRNMPEPAVRQRYGLVWIPPSCLHSTQIEDYMQKIAKRLLPLQTAFIDWKKQADRWVSFHTITESAFRRWFWHAVTDLASEPSALTSNRKAMETRYASDISPKNMFGRR